MADDPESQSIADGGRPTLPPAAPLLGPGSSELNAALCRLEAFLAVLGLHVSASRLRPLLSCAAFLLLGLAAPAVAILLSRCSSGGICESYQIERFEICVLFFEASLATVSLVCISRSMSKYGIRRFLFVDQHHGHLERFQKEYVRKIQVRR